MLPGQGAGRWHPWHKRLQTRNVLPGRTDHAIPGTEKRVHLPRKAMAASGTAYAGG